MFEHEVLQRARFACTLPISYKLGQGGADPLAKSPATNGMCDCTGFTAWALGFKRKTDDMFYLGVNGGWVNSDAIVADGKHPRGFFDEVPRDQARPGDLLVFGKGPGRSWGHAGVVSVVMNGVVLKVVHCSSANHPYAVKETRPDVFWQFGAIVVRHKEMRRTGEAPAAPARPAYVPPAASLPALGRIADLVAQAPRIAANLKGLEHLAALPGALFIESDLDTCSDGVRDKSIKQYDQHHQDEISMGVPVNANAVPYIVLPIGFAAAHGLRRGDAAVVLYKDRVAFAIFCEQGPREKIGEGSLALHRNLGEERVKAGKVQDVGIPRDVVTIVFKDSGNGKYQEPNVIAAIARERFLQLGGELE